MALQLIPGLAAAGLAAGLGMLARGLSAQRSAARIADVGTSSIGMLAAGEVRITGTTVPAGMTLTSRLRVRPSVYYRAQVRDTSGEGERTVVDEQRAIGFFVRDATGEIRVFPRGARWEVPLDGETATAEGGAWIGGETLMLTGDPGVDPLHPGRSDAPDFAMPTLVINSRNSPLAREARFREARIEPGDVVTVVGRALPFRDLADPTEADESGDLDTLTGAVDGNHVPDDRALEDPAVADSYQRAVEEGILVDPARAWGNAAIEGFGIGQPVRAPELDPGVPEASGSPALAAPLAAPPALPPAAPPATSVSVLDHNFEIPPDALVIAAGPDIPLVIAAGSPGEAYQRSESVFLLGILGAALAIASALILALAASGAFGR